MRRIVVDARAFSDAMAKVSRVLKKSPLPILGEICVSVRDGICTLTATDLETGRRSDLCVQQNQGCDEGTGPHGWRAGHGTY